MPNAHENTWNRLKNDTSDIWLLTSEKTCLQASPHSKSVMQKQTKTENIGKCHAKALGKTLGNKFTLRNRKTNAKQNSLFSSTEMENPWIQQPPTIQLLHQTNGMKRNPRTQQAPQYHSTKSIAINRNPVRALSRVPLSGTLTASRDNLGETGKRTREREEMAPAEMTKEETE